MVLAISTNTAAASYSSASAPVRANPIAGGSASASRGGNKAAANVIAQLEAQIAAYQQRLSQARVAGDDASSDATVRQIEQRIAALQQQLNRLGGTTGALIDVFA